MNCYLCGKNSFRVISSKLRYGEPRNVLECQECGLIYLEPKEITLKQFYKSRYREVYSPVIGKKLSSREIFEMYLPYQQRRIDELQSILNPGLNAETKVLEIGCSAGHFLYAMKKHVKECVGIEYNSEDAEFVSSELGIRSYTEPIENTDIPSQYFDLIAILQVLEHVADPLSFLSTVSRYLKRGGHLCVEVPNVQEVLLSVYSISSYKDFYFKEPHIFYYSPKTLEMVMDRAGFSGTMKTVQRYSLMNHMHWLFTGKPQKSAAQGMSPPVLVTDEGVSPNISGEFNEWFQRMDSEYKQLLVKYHLGESILFLGKKGD